MRLGKLGHRGPELAPPEESVHPWKEQGEENSEHHDDQGDFGDGEARPRPRTRREASMIERNSGPGARGGFTIIDDQGDFGDGESRPRPRTRIALDHARFPSFNPV